MRDDLRIQPQTIDPPPEHPAEAPTFDRVTETGMGCLFIFGLAAAGALLGRFVLDDGAFAAAAAVGSGVLGVVGYVTLAEH